jgi:hypothetical protein
MTLYSPEPPRKDCVLHLPFDHIEDDKVLDMSPQKNDATSLGDREHITGVVGRGLRLPGTSVVQTEDSSLDIVEGTISIWFKSEDKIQSTSVIFDKYPYGYSILFNADGSLAIRWGSESGGSTEQLDDGEWHHAALVGDKDANEVYLYVDGDKVDTTSYADPTGEDNTVDVGGRAGNSSVSTTVDVDNARIYRRPLSKSEINALISLSEHNSRMDYREVWENEGVPYVANEPNARFANTLGEEDDYVKRQLDYIYDARHLDYAAGQQLDRIGLLIGLRREEDEGDERYRERIRGTMIAGRSAGTREDVIHATAQIVGIDKSDVRVEHAGTPGDGTVTIPNGALDDRALTTADVKDILEDTVIAGHSITVQERYTNPFTITDDQTANDPLLGLTSDTTSDGGTLVEDL